jgi:hypothetical protein
MGALITAEIGTAAMNTMRARACAGNQKVR